MGAKIPLGRREDQGLEFKAAAALRDPDAISREVVGMLNARGGRAGSVWIGLVDRDGVAVEVDPVRGAEQARSDLLNHLIDAIEPSPEGDEISIVVVKHEGEGDLLRVDVHPVDERKPYAQLKRGGRYFIVRVDHRLRPMTRDEILNPTRRLQREPDSRLTELRDAALQRGGGGLWVAVETVPAVVLDAQDERIEAFLIDPTRSGNRLQGWSFRYATYTDTRPELAPGRVEFGAEKYRKTTIWEDGRVELWVALQALSHRTDAEPEIYPLALVEYTVSIMRLAAHLLAEVARPLPDAVGVDIDLIGAEGWFVPAYPPGTYGYIGRHQPPEKLSADPLQPLARPMRFPWSEFHAKPDRAGYRLVRSLYQALGLPEDRIPDVFDADKERLRLTD